MNPAVAFTPIRTGIPAAPAHFNTTANACASGSGRNDCANSVPARRSETAVADRPGVCVSSGSGAARGVAPARARALRTSANACDNPKLIP